MINHKNTGRVCNELGMPLRNATPKRRVQLAMSVDREVLDVYVRAIPHLECDRAWCDAGIAPSQLTRDAWRDPRVGHARIRPEGSLQLDSDVLARSNATLVRRAAGPSETPGRQVATTAKAQAAAAPPAAA